MYSGYCQCRCVEGVPRSGNGQRLSGCIDVNEQGLSIGGETRSSQLSLKPQAGQWVGVPVRRNPSEVVINDFGVLILTDNEVPVGRNDQIIAVIKLMLRYALEKQFQRIACTIRA